ncbi:MAG: class I SAM-dependent methyltransferase [Polyangiaceae bacterium]|nr:class I SAM-dependent methyltransferase [Polyangiaceae bacterium]
MAKPLTPTDLDALARRTLGHYDAVAESFRAATWEHDVAQNYAAFLGALEGSPPFAILDLGCGPGRDLTFFAAQGHEVVGLDGAEAFVRMARTTGCEVLHQDFLRLALPRGRFDGIFANASLFHVPEQELPRVLRELRDALATRGVLFCSNPHGHDHEGFQGERYGAYLTADTWSAHVTAAGFTLVTQYYRPAGKPRSEQPWLATVWRRTPG